MADFSLDAKAGLALDTARVQRGQVGNGAARRPSQTAKVTPEQARKTAQDFEAMFLGQMMQPMFEPLSTAAPFGGGHAEKMWRSFMIDEYGKAMAKSGGVGIADTVQRQILMAQEGR